MFATRTPHRPNPVGLSLAKLERIDMRTRTLYLSGLDLIDGTPILDIKPYIPEYDSLASAVVPQGVVADVSVGDLGRVEFTEEARAELREHMGVMTLYDSPEEAERFIADTLRVDIRSVCKRARAARSDAHHVTLDRLRIDFEVVVGGGGEGGGSGGGDGEGGGEGDGEGDGNDEVGIAGTAEGERKAQGTGGSVGAGGDASEIKEEALDEGEVTGEGGGTRVVIQRIRPEPKSVNL